MYFLFQKREEHWLIFGKDHTLEKFHKGGRSFIYEKTSFDSSQETVYYLFQLVYALTQRKGFPSTNMIYMIFRITSFVTKKLP